MSPVFALTAISSPHGGSLHGILRLRLPEPAALGRDLSIRLGELSRRGQEARHRPPGGRHVQAAARRPTSRG